MILFLQRKIGGLWYTVRTDTAPDDPQDSFDQALDWLGEVYSGILNLSWPGPYRVIGEADPDDGYVIVAMHLDKSLDRAVSQCLDREAERAAHGRLRLRLV